MALALAPLSNPVRESELLHSARSWGDLVAEHHIPEETVRAFRNAPLRATSIHSFAHGLMDSNILLEYLKYILFLPDGATRASTDSPILSEHGTKNWERGLTPGNWRFSRWVAACHALWSACWRLVDQESNRQGGQPLLSFSTSSWESPSLQHAALLDQVLPENSVVARLRRDTRESYIRRYALKWPGDHLDKYTTPGSRFLDYLHADSQKGNEMRWYAWTRYLSQYQEDLEKKKLPRSISASDHPDLRKRHSDFLMGILEVANGPNLGADKIRKKFDIRRRANCMILDAHAGAHMGLDNKMLNYFTGEALEGKPGFRPVILEELMAADKVIWTAIWDQYNTKEWAFNDLLVEYTIKRQDVDQLLGCRLDISRPLATKIKDRGGNPKGGSPNDRGRSRIPRAGGNPGGNPPVRPPKIRPTKKERNGGAYPKAKAKAAGGKPGKGPQQPGANPCRGDYPAQLATKIDGVEVCQIYHIESKGCNRSDCPRSHRCPIRKKDNTICGGNHPAFRCQLSKDERKNGFTY